MIVGSIKEDLSSEKRVSITPETAKNIMGLGLKVCIEKDYATHLGIDDNEFKKTGVEIKDSFSEVLNSSNLLIKVNCPSENEISLLKEKSILIGMLNPSKNKVQIEKIIKKKIKIHKEYKNNLKQLDSVIFAKEEKNSRNVYWQVGIRIKNQSKNKLVSFLKKNNVDTRNFFYSIRNQPCLKGLIPKRVPKTLNSDILWKEGIYLPSSHNLKNSEIKKICKLIKKFFR